VSDLAVGANQRRELVLKKRIEAAGRLVENE
jgi:hypothetical protein